MREGMRVLLKNEARLYARRVSAIEIKNCVCAYMFTAPARLAWDRFRAGPPGGWPPGAEAFAVLSTLEQTYWMHLDRWRADLEQLAQPCTDSTAPTSPDVSSDRSSSDVT